jgi:hypothetical protein
MDIEGILDRLGRAASPLDELSAPAAAGIYGFYLADGSEVPGISQPGSGPLYVGTSGSLAQREFDTHFASGQSGFSTLRRSLGALLLEDLDLRPEPRGKSASKSNYQNYRFDDGGEDRLSEWMRENLLVAVEALHGAADVERKLIGLACPPLNLTLWANPDAPAIKAARKRCVEMAKQAEMR